MLIGYARVSSNDQDIALIVAKCEHIYQEQTSGGCWNYPELHWLFDQLRKGDVLVVCKLY